MALHYNAVVKELLGTIDGVNVDFTTISPYVAGTIRVIVNGQVLESDDEGYGWLETGEKLVTLVEPPIPGDIVQAFYQDRDSEGLGLDNVVGSPFDPNGILP